MTPVSSRPLEPVAAIWPLDADRRFRGAYKGRRLEIRLERREGDAWRPTEVFQIKTPALTTMTPGFEELWLEAMLVLEARLGEPITPASLIAAGRRAAGQ